MKNLKKLFWLKLRSAGKINEANEIRKEIEKKEIQEAELKLIRDFQKLTNLGE